MFRGNTVRVSREALEAFDAGLAAFEENLENRINRAQARQAAAVTKQRTRPPRQKGSSAGIEERLEALERKVADLEKWKKKTERDQA
jgi:hypothetical protein